MASSFGKKTYGRRTTRVTFSLSVSTLVLLFCLAVAIFGFCIGLNRQHYDFSVKKPISGGKNTAVKDSQSSSSSHGSRGPTIYSLDDLSPDEIHPKANRHRHIVSPPPDDKPISLVSCESTAGYIHIVVQ